MESEPQGKLVLVVDDEPFARLFATQILEDQGFQVLEAEDADQGLRILAVHPDVSILFTDISMPGLMDGVALANSVGRLRPDIGLVVTSGRVEPASDVLPEHARFLRKPYSAHHLRETIREIG